MSDQQTFSEGDDEFYYIFYREIQSESNDLTEDKFVGRKAENIESLLQEVFSSGGGRHEIENLETTTYFVRWINSLLNASTDILPGQDFEESTIQYLEDIAEDFSRSMKTRAKAAGKYVVIIVGQERLIVCHSYTGKRALTTDMEIIEALLSADNIDKYAEFYRSDGQIYVDHFEKHQTESFVNWLGIPEDEVVFEIRGNVNIYSEVAGIECVFEMDRGDLIEKVIQSDEYSLNRNIFRTPNSEPDYKINRVRWGSDTYEDSDAFMQEISSIHYQLSHYDEQYADLMQSLQLFIEEPIDMEEKVVTRGSSGAETHTSKRNEDFEIIFANNHIELQSVWCKSLADDLLADELIPIYHPGHEFAETPTHIGSYRIYNDIGLTGEQQSFVDELIHTITDQKTGNLEPMLCYILFEYLSLATERPMKAVFEELANEFEIRMKQTLSNGSRFIQTEGSAISVEFKASEWLEKEEHDYNIVENIVKKFDQGHRLLVCGLDESTQEVKLLPKDRLRDERIEGLEEKVQSNYEKAGDAHVMPIPIESGHIALAALYI